MLEMKCYISSEKEPISIKSTPDTNLKRFGDVQGCFCVSDYNSAFELMIGFISLNRVILKVTYI